MINNLIQAYRSEFYDLSLAEIWSIIKSKWIILLITALAFIFIGTLLIVSLCCDLPFLMYGVIILEFVFCIVADRYIVKQYQGSLHNEAMHLEKVKTFLETVYPDHSLYCPVKIDILIDRLSEYIQKLQPFKSLTSKLGSFAKTIILPVITYIAGVYSPNLEQLDFASTVGFSIAIIAILAMMYILWIFVSNALRKIIYRDYDAALALCEDLSDVKLVFFSDTPTSPHE